MALRGSASAVVRPLVALSSSGGGAFSTTRTLEMPKKNHASEHILGDFGGVHEKSRGRWRSTPLFPAGRFDKKSTKKEVTGKVQGQTVTLRTEHSYEGLFRNGREAAQILIEAAHRLDVHDEEYLETVEETLNALEPTFDRWPRSAWVAKQLLEPERAYTFRVSWLDDNGTVRVNRGYRFQYSSSCGPYEGPLHFYPSITSSIVKAYAFDTVFMNAIKGDGLGGAAGGADFDQRGKSEAEIQRFCQSYMTELHKYIGQGIDNPTMGFGCGAPELGYLYGQWKRLNEISLVPGKGFLAGGMPRHPEAIGYGVVYFAEAMLKDKGDSLKGKRCLISGSGKVAMYAAEKLMALGAIPLTLSDESGYVLEPQGFDEDKLRGILKIKEERGAHVARYIVVSPTAKFNEPVNMFTVPCDYVFLCGLHGELDEKGAQMLADGGCQGVIEGAWRAVTSKGHQVLKKRGLMRAPYRCTLLGSHYESENTDDIDDILEEAMAKVYKEASRGASEFNSQGNLTLGAINVGFHRVAKHMLAHGTV